MKNIIKKINWEKIDGLVPAIVQDAPTNRVLMLAYMNESALKKTLATGRVWFYSRGRQKLWMKGETSKNYLHLVNLAVDCDGDALLLKASPAGPTCHLNRASCFSQGHNIGEADIGVIGELFKIILQRREELPGDSYTSKLLIAGSEKICAKIEEEAEEVCRAAKQETKQRLVEESVDVLYHLLVLLASKKVDLTEVWQEINKRRQSG